MLTIRLQRRGRKNDPSFRVIVVDSKKKPKTGNYLEMVGSYDPRTDRVELKADRIKEWMQGGAKASDTVHNLLVSQKVIDGKKINILPKFKAAEAAPEAAVSTEAEKTEAAAPTEEVASASAEVEAPAETEAGDASIASEASAE